ncbi:MAG TPA: hypothetical protein VGK67_05650 [Myxococcales bacterium]|jgi:hypothetical protein
MTEWVFEVPEDLRAFLLEVVEAIDQVPAQERAQAFRAEDAFQSGCGYGGRDGERFRFVYFPERRGERWILALDEAEIRAFAGGARRLLTPRIEKAERKPQRWPSGEGLLVWGRTSREAMAAGDLQELACALEALRGQGKRSPQVFRLWSRLDDLLRAVVFEDRCALQVAFQDGTCLRTQGDPAAPGELEAEDVDGTQFKVRWAHALAWEQVAQALPTFVQTGELGSLPTQDTSEPRLAQLASLGRRGALHDLGPVPRGLEGTSLAVPTPESAIPALTEGDEDLAWARGVLDWLGSLALVELEDAAAAARGLAELLRERGDEAVDSLEEAEELLEQMAGLAGFSEIFASVDELRRALKESSGR